MHAFLNVAGKLEAISDLLSRVVLDISEATYLRDRKTTIKCTTARQPKTKPVNAFIYISRIKNICGICGKNIWVFMAQLVRL